MNPFASQNRFGGQTFTKRNRYKLKDGDNVYRILPAMGNQAEDGRWSVYYSVVFGFKSTDGKHYPFQSPETYDRKEKRVTVECPATNLIKNLKTQLEKAKEAGNKEQTAAITKLVGDYPVMGVYSLNNDHYVNVIDRQGNIGYLQLGHKAKLALDAERKRVNDEEGFDILSADNGRFVNFRRTGKGRDTMVGVTVVKEKVDAEVNGVKRKVDQDIVHVIDKELQNRLIAHKDGKWVYKEAFNLDDLYQTPSAEEVQLIVNNADITTGISAGVDAVKKKKPVLETEVTESTQPVQSAAAPLSQQPAVEVDSPVTQATAPAPAVAPTLTPVTQTAVAKETKAAAKATPPASATQTTAEKVAAMTPDQFMSMLGDL
jgi:hypothetical protein